VNPERELLLGLSWHGIRRDHALQNISVKKIVSPRKGYRFVITD